MPEIQSIVATFVLASFLVLFAVHVIYKEKMRGANLVFAVISIILLGCGVLVMIWEPFSMRMPDALPMAIITIGTAGGFIYAAYNFEANKEQMPGNDSGNIEDEHVASDDESTSNSAAANSQANTTAGPNVVIHADSFIANAHLNSTVIGLQSTDINSHVVKSTSINETKNTITNNDTTNYSTQNNTYNNIASNDASEGSRAPEDTATASNERTESPEGGTLHSAKQDYFASKSETEKDFIKKYVRYEFRNRPVLEALTRYFDQYRGNNDKDTFVLQAFYSIRLTAHWLTEEPSRADYIKIWGDAHLGGKSAYSEAKKSLDKMDLSKTRTVGKKIEGCMNDVEREMGLAKDEFE